MQTEPSHQPKRRRRKRYPVGVRVRCTHAERETIGRNARRAGRSVSRFLVELGTADAGQTLAPPPSGEELAVLEALIFQLRKVGINQNQLVHRGHRAETDGRVAAPDNSELREEIRAIEETVRRIRQRLA